MAIKAETETKTPLEQHKEQIETLLEKVSEWERLNKRTQAETEVLLRSLTSTVKAFLKELEKEKQ